MSASTPLRALQKNPSLLLLWLGQILSQAGSKMYAISLSWWFLEALPERAGLWIGVMLVLTSLPGILFVKQIGNKVDRAEPQSLLKRMDLLAGLVCLLPLLFAAKISVFAVVVCAVAFLLATCQAFLDPALLRSISFVTQKEDREAATGLISSTYSVAGFLGALLGAGAIAAVGVKGSIALNAGSYFLAFFLTSLARFSFPALEEVTHPAGGAPGTSTFTNLADFFKAKRLLRNLLYLFGAINFFSTPILILIPIYTKRVLSLGAQELAFFEAALWIGMLLGSLSLNFWKFVRNPLLLGAVALTLFGSSLVLPLLDGGFWLYLSALFFSGYFMGVNNVRFLTLFQEKVPLQIQGSFFSRLTALCSFMVPISFLVYGFFADQVSIHSLMLSQAAGVLLLASPLWGMSRKGSGLL
jgi:MFS family permease